MLKTDVLVVGSGLCGATFAERMAERGKTVLVVEAREHVGGNAYDEYDKSGILIHKYGPHCFHTNSDKVWSYLSGFTNWRPYEHTLRASVAGVYVPVPFNFHSIIQLFPNRTASELIHLLGKTFGVGSRVPIRVLAESRIQDVRCLGEFIHENIIRHYTEKQWGSYADTLHPSVTARISMMMGFDSRVHADKYQAIPSAGYTPMIRAMLGHRNIRVLLKTKFEDVRESIKAKLTFYTGPLDTYFGGKHGVLPYRSTRFQFEHHADGRKLPAGTISYPNSEEFTRVTDLKTITGQDVAGTVHVREFPQEHKLDGSTEPYYPVPSSDVAPIFAKYKAATKRFRRVIFAGRLGSYQYLNMDQAVAQALAIHEKLCA